MLNRFAALALVLGLFASLTACSDPPVSVPPPVEDADVEALDTPAEDEPTPILEPDVPAPMDVPVEDTPPQEEDADAVEDGDVVEDADIEEIVLPEEASAIVPLGETLFMEGDDYLAFWGAEHPEVVEIIGVPEASVLEVGVIAPDGRLTPDVEGGFYLRRGDDLRLIEVRGDTLNEDTFLNFNYTPVEPLALTAPDELWVASPPSNAVHRVQLGPDGEEARELIPTGAWPTSVAKWGYFLLVAQTGRDSLGFLDLGQRRVVDAIEVGDEPANIVVDTRDPEAPRAYVALSGINAVVAVDLLRREVVGRVEVSRDPRAMAFDPIGGRLFVASSLSSNATPKGILQRVPVPVEEQRDIAVIDVETFEVQDWLRAAGTLLRGLWLDPEEPRRLVVTRTNANNAQAGVDADSRPHHHGLTLVDIEVGSPTEYEIIREVDLDFQASSTGAAANPFSIARTPDAERFIVSLTGGRSLLVLDATTFEEIERLEAGRDPRGLVFAQDRLHTFAWLDNALMSWPLGEGTDRRQLTVGDDPTPIEVKEGQRIFNDARFSRNGDISCGNCHPDGLTDGLVWNILLDGDVNTLAFRNVGGTAPFLWGGILPTLFDFSREVLRLVGATASGQEMESLTTYMQSVTAPPNPHTLPGGRFTPEAERGRVIFETSVEEGGAGCNGCHSGALYTNFEAVEGKTPSLITDVPSLIGVYDTGPWGRQGQWETLEEMMAFATGFTGARLEPEAAEALLAYVRQLPGDVLYLNSASPLDNSRQVWFQTPVFLTFSSVLAPEQASHFELLLDIDDALTPVEGTWTLRGRKASFEPLEPLRQESSYVIRVASGLSGVLGRVMQAPLALRFETGGVPELDVSGRWLWVIEGLLTGEVVVAMIQATGGHVSGTILESAEDLDFDHVEGFITGTSMFLDPFLVQTPFGEVLVEEVEALYTDDDEDGMADRGTGSLHSIVDLDLTMIRLAYPGDD